MRGVLSCCAVALSASILAQPITVRDFRKLAIVSSVAVSPNGRSVAFIRQVGDFANDKNVTTLMTVDPRTGMVKSIAPNAGNPRWSPNGRTIAYTSQGKEKTDQIFVVSASGGKARQVTHAKAGVQQFAWSPAGDRFVYATPDEPANGAALARHDDLFDIGDVGLLASTASVPSHLWLIASTGGKPKRLTHGAWSVLENPSPFMGYPADPSWSADGRWITFCREETPDNSVTDRTCVAIADVSTGKVKELTDSRSYEYQAAFAPRGNSIGYIFPKERPLSSMQVVATSPAGGKTVLTSDLDVDVSSFSFMPNGRDLLVIANDHVQKRLWHVVGGAARSVRMGNLCAEEFSVGASGAVAMVASTPASAPEVYLFESVSGSPRRLTNFNAELDRHSFGKSEEFNWTGPDGEKSDAVLTYPVGYSPSRKYPLFVWVHGGPEDGSLSGLLHGEQRYLRQVLAGKGYMVFEPNYRGSDNLGNAHETAIFGNPGEGPASDVLSGLDALVEKVNVDTSRIILGGHSYGGYMTAWLIAHDHRWRNAIVADGAVDWLSTYCFSNSGNLAWARDSIGGTPWDPATAELYRTGSPITYAAEITTPTLIITGTADQQVPMTESFLLYHALHDRHIPVRFVGIPGAEHTATRPVQYERYIEIMVQWVLSH